MNKLIVLFVLVLGLLVLPSRANAGPVGYGYICWASVSVSASTYGDAGYATGRVWSQPGCTGTDMGQYYLCTTGATYSYCSGLIYNETMFKAQVDNISRALTYGQKVWIWTNAGNIVSTLNVYSN